MKSFTMTRVVEPSDLDALQHMNNVRYLEWVQDISRDHWKSLRIENESTKYLWVVRSHDITYFASALLGDTLEVETFVREMKGPISTRIVRFRKSGSDSLLAECKTEWVLLGRRSMRPMRIPADIVQNLLPDRE